MPVHDCFAGITVPSLLFYVAAVPGFAFALLAWLVRNRSDANVIVFYSVLPQALLYALFLAAAIGQRPAILWSVFTLKQVTWMYTSPLIVVASLAHYAASDLIAARVVWIIFRALGATQWYYHLITGGLSVGHGGHPQQGSNTVGAVEIPLAAPRAARKAGVFCDSSKI
jgi:hypothetical protein